MAQDDMHVVMYKILAYIYACMKDGVCVNKNKIMHDGEFANVPYRYWTQIMGQLVDKGLVAGVSVFRSMGGDITVNIDEPYLTLEGVEFLKENNMMRKALEFLKETKSALLFI